MIKRLSTQHPNLTFWISFLLLNSLLFLPIYWFFRADISFWPLATPLESNPVELLSELFLQRPNLDIFRLNLELLIIILLWVFVPQMQKWWFLTLAFILYLGQLIYVIYEAFIRSYYLLDPIFYNDFFLFAGGTRYVLNSLNISSLLYLGVLVAIAIGAGLLFALHRLLLTKDQPAHLSKTTRGALIIIGIITLVPIVTFKGESGLPETAVTSFTAKINQNIQLSRIAKADAARFDSQDLAPFYQFTESQLQDKPNIYFIFIESYGSVLYKRPDYQVQYKKLLFTLKTQLEQSDWEMASIRSNAPTWGGGSWLSYTSVLTGLRIESHAQYQALFNRYYEEPFPHLFNYLRGQGYRSYWLNSNSDELNDIEWQRYQNFYGVDEWIQFSDMHYVGPLYGWGPTPPDQYAINFAHDYMNQDTDNPHVFFYITQNSHYPWTPLPELTPSWQTLNDLPPLSPLSNQRVTQRELREQYLTSIEYELTMLTDFITQEAEEDDIFVLIGDHQPARVARYTDGWDTPIHIISKNSAFVEAFYEYGFVPSLNTHQIQTTIQHEGF